MTESQDTAQIARITAFSDGVIAIAITLLAFQVTPPDLPPGDVAAQFGTILLNIVPSVAGYLHAFIVAGIYWTLHHRFFGYIKRCAQGLLWVNLLFLVVIGFLPVPGTFMIRYFAQPMVMLFYLACIIVTGLATALLWWYITAHHRLVDATLSPAYIRYVTVRVFIPPAAAILAILLYFVWSYAVYSFSYLIIFGFVLLPRLYKAPAEYITTPTSEPT